MIPILYDSAETHFTSNGLGRLADCISCKVTESRNGEFECEFEYPLTGAHYEDIIEGRIIAVTHDEQKDIQPFEIYRRNAPINGVITFYAHHISYRLSNVILRPFTASSAASALAQFETNTFNPNPFTFWTDITRAGSFKVTRPASVRSMMGGVEGSILDVYNGEYEYDMFTVKLHASRGADNGVTIRYGKNLTDLKQTYDTLDLYNAVVPYWEKDGVVVYGEMVSGQGGIEYQAKWTDDQTHIMQDDNENDFTFSYYQTHTTTMDLSSEFEEQPTPEELQAKAESILNNNESWLPKENISFDFVALWQTDEYADIAPLERVQLCDTVTVEYKALGVKAKAKVIKVVWNVLTDKYDNMEIGNAVSSFADTIKASIDKEIKELPTYSTMQEAIDNATSLITGGMGGHVVFSYDEAGKPTEIFVMDTDDVNTAVHVLRINVNGIGFSSNGINGQYRTAWTLDGHFVADFIDTGLLSANLIRAGVLASRDGRSFWDLDGSQFEFCDKSFNSTVTLDEGYIKFSYNNQPFGWLIRRAFDGNPVFAIESGNRSNMMILSSDGIRYYVQGLYTISVTDFFRVYSGDSKITLCDNGDLQYVDLNSGGDTYIRVDGDEKRITMQHDGAFGSPVLTDDGGGFAEIKKIYLSQNSGGTPFLICQSADGSDYYVNLTQI